MKHFSDLSVLEVNEMISDCRQSAVDYAEKKGMSGLSELGHFNVYRAIENGIREQWELAKQLKSA
ncbi:hypothetical protein QUF90_25615 [Desulfococcaceae bacterium HSG9]|nr:hypothetical protein [Desulfococcaceae bacterium HSG9]